MAVPRLHDTDRGARSTRAGREDLKRAGMMADRNRLPDREDPDPGSIADGDAPLDTSPPSAVETEPPAQPLTEDQDETESAAEAERIESDLESLQRDLASASDRYLRLAAEFDNYRKRVDRERADVHGRAQAELAARLLDPLDDLERVAQHADDTETPLLQGVQLVERKLRQALQAAGLEPVSAEGARFDPNSMEAVAMVETDSREEDEIVSDVFQRGYYFKGTLIRPARVRVKKHGS
jgi:molecular chaperone GrpE